MKPPLLNFEIFWKDLDQKTPEKRPKTRSKFVKSTNSCHWEFSSSFWCVVFSLLALDFDFFSEPKHKPIWSPLEIQVFKRFFLYSNGSFLSGFSFWFPDLRFLISQIFFGLYGLLILTFPFFSAMHHTVATDCCTQYYSLQASVFWRNNSVCLKWKIQIFKSFWL